MKIYRKEINLLNLFKNYLRNDIFITNPKAILFNNLCKSLKLLNLFED